MLVDNTLARTRWSFTHFLRFLVVIVVFLSNGGLSQGKVARLEVPGSVPSLLMGAYSNQDSKCRQYAIELSVRAIDPATFWGPSWWCCGWPEKGLASGNPKMWAELWT
jgi:hypothetical protein